MKKILCLIAFVFCAFISYAQNCDQYPRPIKGKRVYDYYNKIDPVDESYLQSLATRFEDSTGFQMAIITLEDLGGKDEFSYAQELGNCWGVGERNVDNGLLIIVSFEDRTWRIHTGKKTEIYLTDATSNRLGEMILIPSLKTNTPSKGIRETVDAVINHLGWESWEERERAKAQLAQRAAESLRTVFSWLLGIILLGAATLFSLLFVRHLKIKKRVKAKIAEWEKEILSMQSEFNVTGWPNWAKEEMQTLQRDFTKGMGEFDDQKEKTLSLLSKKPKVAEQEGLSQLEVIFSRLQQLKDAVHKLPKKIADFKTGAPIAIHNSYTEWLSLKNAVEEFQKDGFTLKLFVDDVVKNVTMLEDWQQKLQTQASQNPDLYKEAVSAGLLYTGEAQEFRKRIGNLFANRALISENAKDLIYKIDLIARDRKHDASDILGILSEKYPPSVSESLQTQYNQVDAMIADARENYTEAVRLNSMEVQEFEKAYECYTLSTTITANIETLFQTITTTLTRQREAEKNFPEAKSSAQGAIKKAESKCRDSDVESSTKSILSSANTKYAAALLKTGNLPVDWTTAFSMMKEAGSLALSAYRKAEEDIADAAEARRRRKREEEEREERRRRESGYSSTSTSSGWGGSSSGGSFGGGGFGGGGAGGKW